MPDLVMMTSEPVPEKKCIDGLKEMASLPPSTEFNDAVDKATGAGIGFLAILRAILAHSGDIQAIIAAILALIPLSPPTAKS